MNVLYELEKRMIHFRENKSSNLEQNNFRGILETVKKR